MYNTNFDDIVSDVKAHNPYQYDIVLSYHCYTSPQLHKLYGALQSNIAVKTLTLEGVPLCMDSILPLRKLLKYNKNIKVIIRSNNLNDLQLRMLNEIQLYIKDNTRLVIQNL